METFICKYCKGEVRVGDKHAHVIEKKNIKDKLSIVVTCLIFREYEIELKEN